MVKIKSLKLLLFLIFFIIAAVSDLYAESYVVHISSYQKEDDAVLNKKLLEKNNFTAFVKKVGLEGKGVWFRVLVGPYSDYDQAVNTASTLIQRKLASYVKIMPDCGFKYISKDNEDYIAICVGGNYDGSVFEIKKSGNVFRAVTKISVINRDAEGNCREEAGSKACGCR